MMLLLHQSSLVLTMATDLKLHNKFWEEVRVVVLHVQARQVHGPVAVRDRHQLDHLDTTWHNLTQLAQRELIILFHMRGWLGRWPGSLVVARIVALHQLSPALKNIIVQNSFQMEVEWTRQKSWHHAPGRKGSRDSVMVETRHGSSSCKLSLKEEETEGEGPAACRAPSAPRWAASLACRAWPGGSCAGPPPPPPRWRGRRASPCSPTSPSAPSADVQVLHQPPPQRPEEHFLLWIEVK